MPGILTLARAGVVVVALTSTSLARPAAPAAKDEPITITGCVVRANMPARTESLLAWAPGDILLSNVDARTSDGANAIGTAGNDKTVFYWLNDDEDLSKHVGHQVQITGDLDEDFKHGEIEIKRKDDFTEIEFDFGDKEMKARVPTAMLSPATPRKAEYDVVVRKVDVDSVKMLSNSCPGR